VVGAGRVTDISALRRPATGSRRAARPRCQASLICRADGRGDPVVQISPPLVAQQEQFYEIVGILGDVLAEAGERMR
jgi:4-aminobutyrate aminotransferase-like enzyme